MIGFIFYKQVAPTELYIIGFYFLQKSRRDDLFVEEEDFNIINKLHRSVLLYSSTILPDGRVSRQVNFSVKCSEHIHAVNSD
ncbi:MAG: hypothetical protein IIA88_06340 [Bacteroidetes bacterium]|nr:hypothetical protein [Bacteroidota bacterium]